MLQHCYQHVLLLILCIQCSLRLFTSGSAQFRCAPPQMASATTAASSNPAEPEALKLAFSYLVNSIDTSSLLPAAFSKGLISERQKADCASEPNPYQRAEKFLEHLQREVNGDSQKFHTFMCLLADTGHLNLASRLCS